MPRKSSRSRSRPKKDKSRKKRSRSDSRSPSRSRRASPDYGDYKGPPRAKKQRRRSSSPARGARQEEGDYLKERNKRREERDDDDIWADVDDGSPSRSRSAAKKPVAKAKDKSKDKVKDKSKSRSRSSSAENFQATRAQEAKKAKESAVEGASDSGSDSDSDSESRKKRKKKAKKKKSKAKKSKSKKKSKKSKKKNKKEESSESEDDSESEKETPPAAQDQPATEVVPAPPTALATATPNSDALKRLDAAGEGLDQETSNDPFAVDDFVGPRPPPKEAALDRRSYGGALMPGEGSAIAQFVQKGVRIPRRGEIGLTSAQIAGYEDMGYVMSGSRHQRMNAIRIRKENQVYSAEEKRALSLLNMEEKENREKKLMADFRRYIRDKQQDRGMAVDADALPAKQEAAVPMIDLRTAKAAGAT